MEPSTSAVDGLERIILAGIITDRGVYDTFRRHGDADGLGAVGRHIYTIVGGYYDADSGIRCVPREIVEARAARDLTNPKHAEAVKRYLRELPSDVSIPNTINDIRAHKRAAIGDKLSLALANRSPEAEALLKQYRDIETASPGSSGEESQLIDIFDTTDLTSGQDGTREQLIKLWPKSLNDRCDGGAKRGHQILVFGRPESGKTLVTINLVAGFLHQKLNVLYVANEEPAADIRGRIRQRLLKLPKHELRANPERAAEALGAADLGRLDIAALSPGSFQEIQRLLDGKAYDVLVLDQLRNIRVSAGTRVEELEQAATEARNLGKRAGVLVVSVTQAGDSATGKIYLELNDVDGSKTGIPAQMDLMLGVGSTDATRQAGIIGLSTPKNKLSGQHEGFQTQVNFATGVLS